MPQKGIIPRSIIDETMPRRVADSQLQQRPRIPTQLHADDLVHTQIGGARHAREFGRFDELCVIVGAPRQKVQDIFRPDDGIVKVRFDDDRVIEVTVDIHDGSILHVGERNDVFLEKLHTGEIFGGQAFVILADIAAGALVLTLITGYWLWLVPKLSRGARDGDAA